MSHTLEERRVASDLVAGLYQIEAFFPTLPATVNEITTQLENLDPIKQGVMNAETKQHIIDCFRMAEGYHLLSHGHGFENIEAMRRDMARIAGTR